MSLVSMLYIVEMTEARKHVFCYQYVLMGFALTAGNHSWTLRNVKGRARQILLINVHTNFHLSAYTITRSYACISLHKTPEKLAFFVWISSWLCIFCFSYCIRTYVKRYTCTNRYILQKQQKKCVTPLNSNLVFPSKRYANACHVLWVAVLKVISRRPLQLPPCNKSPLRQSFIFSSRA